MPLPEARGSANGNGLIDEQRGGHAAGRPTIHIDRQRVAGIPADQQRVSMLGERSSTSWALIVTVLVRLPRNPAC